MCLFVQQLATASRSCADWLFCTKIEWMKNKKFGLSMFPVIVELFLMMARASPELFAKDALHLHDFRPVLKAIVWPFHRSISCPDSKKSPATTSPRSTWAQNLTEPTFPDSEPCATEALLWCFRALTCRSLRCCGYISNLLPQHPPLS